MNVATMIPSNAPVSVVNAPPDRDQELFGSAPVRYGVLTTSSSLVCVDKLVERVLVAARFADDQRLG